MHSSNSKLRKVLALIAAVASIALAAGCASNTESKTVTLATHDSFVMSKSLQHQFERESGYKLRIAKLGDAGALTNKLILTKDAPIADAYFGVDNTFIGTPGFEKAGQTYQAIDYADVCVNYDKYWFKDHAVAAPSSYLDLTKPAYRNLTVTENITTSSTGLAFFAMTVWELGKTRAEAYWRALKANGLKTDAGWEDAYYTDFSGSSGKGAYPIVISYSSSPADEVRADGTSQTAALTAPCFRQTEYSGVLQRAANPAGAKALVKFFMGNLFQTALPEAMYVMPVKANVPVPEAWSLYANAVTKIVNATVTKSQRTAWFAFWKQLVG